MGLKRKKEVYEIFLPIVVALWVRLVARHGEKGVWDSGDDDRN
jgi:hypothetical protein